MSGGESRQMLTPLAKNPPVFCKKFPAFWDLRRWKEDLNVPAYGIKITNGVYEIITVENRLFADYMYCGPLPYDDLVKAGLIQNTGW